MHAAVHPNEISRLAALGRYDILDTPFERDYDDVVDIARRVCGTPASTITFIDEGRQWFKAVVGLGNREGPLGTSLCAHTILEDEFIEIPDTWADPRFADNPLCANVPGCRFYAGVVLRTVDGFPIGTLCVLDFAPKRLDDLQRDTLRLLAAQVMRQLELRAALAREALLRREIDHRVKNSLQSVGAFVRLQRRQPSGTTDDMLSAVERQIASVAILHDMISKIDGDRLDLADYLVRLTHQLAAIAPADVAVTGHFDPFAGSAAMAGALGTIVNELVANSLKHSFDEAGVGNVTLTGSLVADGSYVVDCVDDGVRAVVFAAEPGRIGIGLRVMQAAVRTLNGTLTGGAVDGGYRSVLAFPAPLH